MVCGWLITVVAENGLLTTDYCQVSNSYPQDFAHDKHAGELQTQSGRNQIMSALVLPKNGHVFRIQNGDHEGDEYGKRA